VYNDATSIAYLLDPHYCGKRLNQELEEELKTYIYEYKWETGESSDITKAREVTLIDELNSFLGTYREEMELSSLIYK